MILLQTFDKPINGWWNGGSKKTFEWSMEGCIQQDSKGEYIKVGSWSANHWFNVAVGKTDKLTLSNARRRLSAIANKHGMNCTFEYIDKD